MSSLYFSLDTGLLCCIVGLLGVLEMPDAALVVVGEERPVMLCPVVGLDTLDAGDVFFTGAASELVSTASS